MHTKSALVMCLTVVALAAYGSSPEPEPGLYKVTVGVSGDGLAPGEVQETAEQCVTEADLASDPADLLGEHAGMEGCSITDSAWSDGKISMSMVCAIEGVDAVAESIGSYNATSYQLVTTMTMKIGEMQIEMQSTVEAERIGDC